MESLIAIYFVLLILTRAFRVIFVVLLFFLIIALFAINNARRDENVKKFKLDRFDKQ